MHLSLWAAVLLPGQDLSQPSLLPGTFSRALQGRTGKPALPGLVSGPDQEPFSSAAPINSKAGADPFPSRCSPGAVLSSWFLQHRGIRTVTSCAVELSYSGDAQCSCRVQQ